MTNPSLDPLCPSRRWLFAGGVALLCVLPPGVAAASNFDAQGVLTFDPNAAFTESFESFVPEAGTEVVTGNALEGQSFLRLNGGSDAAVQLAIPSVAGASAWRVRAFVRTTSSWIVFLSVKYTAPLGAPYSLATLSPTGRMTSDGWVELESRPLAIDGARSHDIRLVVSGDALDLDAVELVEVPGAFTATTACSGVASSACGAGQVCAQGYCQDGDAMVAPLPSAARRNLIIDVLKRKIDTFFGGVYTRSVPMKVAMATLESLRDASTAWQFWNGIATSIVQLQDSHTSPFGLPNYFARGGRAFPVCIVEGDGDLSHQLAPSTPDLPDLLVSHVGPDKNLGLKPGDRIVAVDGQHPLTWMRSLVGLDWGFFNSSDPSVFSGWVEGLPVAIRTYAGSIQVVRCDSATKACSAPETLQVSSFPEDSEQTVSPACDHRPAYHLASNNPDPVTHELYDVRYGLLADSQPGEEFYGMIWNDTMWDPGQPNPWKEAYDAFRANAKGVILDHRTGNGGTPNGAAYLTELSLQPKLASVWSISGMLGLFGESFSTADGLSLVDRWQTDPMRSYSVGSSTPREDIRIAVLLARDVSGSDFFPYGVKGQPNTRLFGRRTMGAFSTFLIFETPSFMGWSLASGDFVDPTGQPQMGKGVEPDENIVPSQSDLLAGKDTVYERALAWVRCGKAVCP